MNNTIARYYIEHLPEHINPHHASQRSMLHPHTREHHWIRLDATTIIGIGHFKSGEIAAKIHAHPHVIVLPHLHSRTSFKTVMDSKTAVAPIHTGRYEILKQKLSLQEDDLTVDFIGKLIDRGYYCFEPKI